ncbi:MAG: malonyl-CoA synthase [Pseudomonadota bacterium]
MSSTNPLYDRFIGARRADERPFLHLSDGQQVRYSEAMASAHQIAHVLAGKGVQPGDRVAVQVGKSPEALYLYFACIAAGAVFLPLNTAYTAVELEYFVGDAEPSLVVCDPAYREALAPVAAKSGATLMTMGTSGDGDLIAAAKDKPTAFEPPRLAQDDLAAILYTSGTTGRAKGAMLTQQNLLSNAETLTEYWRFGEGDVLLHALPIFHTHGLFVATNVTLSAGSSMIFLPKFDLDRMIAEMPRATAMMGVPTFYTRLLSDARFTKDLTADMRLFVSGSAPLLAQTHSDFAERTGHRILERYGMSETGMITSNPYDGERRAGTVGYALPGISVRVVDTTTGQPLPPGETGMIEVKGPNVFKGYWRMPEKTAAEMREDGFFVTGDLGVQEPDGRLSIVGRGKDLIISGGFNVYPKEIETEIDALDGVVESAVIGLPHSDFGEGVAAVIVQAPGAKLSESDVQSALSGRLAKFKQPKRVLFVDALPRNAMGKVQKQALRTDYADTFAP